MTTIGVDFVSYQLVPSFAAHLFNFGRDSALSKLETKP
jgi:hypothetical protein